MTIYNGLGVSGNVTLTDSIIHDGDTDTKIRFTGPDTISAETGGTERLRIDSTGRVMIATTVAGTNSDLTIGDASSGSTGRIRIRSASNAGGYIDFQDTTGNTVDGSIEYNHILNSFNFYFGSQERFRIHTQGMLGLSGANYGTSGQVLTSGGTGSPVSWTTITGTTINSNADNRVITGSGTANTLNGESNVNINGGILIAGHTTSTTVSDGEGPFIQVKSTDSRGGISLLRHSANAAGGGVYIAKSRNATIGSNTVVQANDELGRITFSGDDGNDIHTQAAAIKAYVDGTPGGNDMPGRLTFLTTADGAAAPTERLRITKDGDFVMHSASPNHDTSSGSIFLKAPSGNPNRGIKWSDTSDTHYVKLEPSVIDGLTINGYSGVAFATGSRSNGTWTERLRLTITGLLHGASDAQGNTTLGGNAGNSFSGTNALQNTLIGYDAGTAITSGDQNVALGYNALKTLSTNGGCIAIGANALEDCTGGGNTGVGYNALKELSAGTNNTALGFDAATNTVGNLNVAIGRDAMKTSANASSHDNCVIGAYAATNANYIYRNVIIGRNALAEYNGTNAIHSSVILGYFAGAKLGSGGNNVIIGANAMNGANTTTANQTGLSNNIAIGQNSLQNAKNSTHGCIVMGENAAQNAATGTGTYSYWSNVIAIGSNCLKDATGGSDSIVAVGPNAMEYHTGDGDASSGGYTVAYGASAFRNNRHIRHSVAVGNQAGTDWNPAKGAMHEGSSTFIGGGAGRTCSTGTALIAVGRDALSGGGPCTGVHNTAIGSRCFERITSGSNNCAVGGLYTGLMLTTGDYNNYFGSLAGYAYNVNTGATGDHQNIFGGYSAASGNNDHENIFGGGLTGKGANTTFIRGPVYNSPNTSSFSTTSDERIKKNIVDNNIGLDAIEKIRVRNFEYRTKDEITDFDYADAVVVEKEGVQLGVIAQEIKEILPDVVKQNTTGAYAVDPDNITWYLVNAVKELSAEVKSLKAQLNS